MQKKVASVKVVHTTPKRRKTTKAERRTRVYHPKFNQYAKMQDLSHHHPLKAEDCTELQAMSGRDFDLNSQNEILLKMSRDPDLKDRTFCSRVQFYAYFAKALNGEKRDAVACSNKGFYIKSNKTKEERQEHKTLAEREVYLNKEETTAIRTRCDYTQLRAKIAGTFPTNKGYDLLTSLIAVRRKGTIFEMTVVKDVVLSDLQRQELLKQVNAVGGYAGVGELEFFLNQGGVQ